MPDFVKMTFEPRWINKLSKTVAKDVNKLIRIWNRNAPKQFTRAIKESLASDQYLSAYANLSDSFKYDVERFGTARASGAKIRISGRKLEIKFKLREGVETRLISEWGHDAYWKFMTYSFGRKSFTPSAGPKGWIPIRGGPGEVNTTKTYRRNSPPGEYQNKVDPSNRTGVSFIKPRTFPSVPAKSGWFKRAKYLTVVRVNRAIRKRG